MKEFHLAQLNIAKMLATKEDPIMQDFVNNLDRINSLADKSVGFVWRMIEEIENPFNDDSLLINMSVWEDLDSLFSFTYNSDHVQIFKRKKEWFSKIDTMHMVSWYIHKGHLPTLIEAKKRLDYLIVHGETPYAFSFKSKFTPQDLDNYNIH